MTEVGSESLIDSTAQRQDLLDVSHIRSSTFPVYFDGHVKHDVVSYCCKYTRSQKKGATLTMAITLSVLVLIFQFSKVMQQHT